VSRDLVESRRRPVRVLRPRQPVSEAATRVPAAVGGDPDLLRYDHRIRREFLYFAEDAPRPTPGLRHYVARPGGDDPVLRPVLDP